MVCLGMHSYVMLHFMVQAFQDPPLSSSTVFCMVNGDEITMFTPMEPKYYTRKEVLKKLSGKQTAYFIICA
jgi:hypothetical protein